MKKIFHPIEARLLFHPKLKLSKTPLVNAVHTHTLPAKVEISIGVYFYDLLLVVEISSNLISRPRINKTSNGTRNTAAAIKPTAGLIRNYNRPTRPYRKRIDRRFSRIEPPARFPFIPVIPPTSAKLWQRITYTHQSAPKLSNDPSKLDRE